MPEPISADEPMSAQQTQLRVGLAAVAVGSAVGALARWLLTATTSHTLTATWAINVGGCAAMGLLMAGWEQVTATDGLLLLVRPALATGVLGGFTTYSAYALGVVDLVQHNRPLAALGYLTSTVIAALLAAAVGHALGLHWTRPTPPGGAGRWSRRWTRKVEQ